jgi:hypothetical protein
MLIEKGGQRLPCQSKICSGLNSSSKQFCVDCSGIFNFNLKFKNDVLNIYETIQISAKVGPIPEPIFIGDPTCRANSLTIRCFKAFVDTSLNEVLSDTERFSLIQLLSYNSSTVAPLTHTDQSHHMSWSQVSVLTGDSLSSIHPIYQNYQF